MKKLTSRHLTADLYGCKEELRSEFSGRIREIFRENGCEVISAIEKSMDEKHSVILMVLENGHFAVHIYSDISYVAADIFMCSTAAEPEKMLQGLRKIFKPLKFRTTFLKRGDFSVTGADMKPKVKTRLAPLRHIKSAGAKALRILAHRRMYPPE